MYCKKSFSCNRGLSPVSLSNGSKRNPIADRKQGKKSNYKTSAGVRLKIFVWISEAT